VGEREGERKDTFVPEFSITGASAYVAPAVSTPLDFGSYYLGLREYKFRWQ